MASLPGPFDEPRQERNIIARYRGWARIRLPRSPRWVHPSITCTPRTPVSNPGRWRATAGSRSGPRERSPSAPVWAYTSIASVQEILVLRADRMAAELLRRRRKTSGPSARSRLPGRPGARERRFSGGPRRALRAHRPAEAARHRLPIAANRLRPQFPPISPIPTAVDLIP